MAWYVVSFLAGAIFGAGVLAAVLNHLLKEDK